MVSANEPHAPDAADLLHKPLHWAHQAHAFLFMLAPSPHCRRTHQRAQQLRQSARIKGGESSKHCVLQLWCLQEVSRALLSMPALSELVLCGMRFSAFTGLSSCLCR
jgi:hypothetical protein